MYTVEATEKFLRVARRFFQRHPELSSRFESVVELLQHNPRDPSLRLHALTGELKGLYAIRLTYSYRITLIIRFTEEVIVLIDIGPHDKVYR